jgi:hypothetical protein
MTKILSILSCLLLITAMLPAQSFIHPGMDQSRADLEYMKHEARKGAEPYKTAYDKIKAGINLDYQPKAFAHVLRGPYGKPNIGGGELSKDASLAYNCALVWYISGDKAYANKAIDILRAWSGTVWDFDYNDAKLLAAWTGHQLCNAAEILRSSNAGWQQKYIDRFKNMLMTVYYPLIRFYFPQANGNWDGAIIHSIIAIAVFTDNRAMYNNAIDHFLHGPVNGSIFKYIYPSGQCQESPRDQGHVQLGLGEFAGAAQIAFTQGTDLFSIAGNRIGLGFEYTAKFVLGETPHCYGVISERAKKLSDNYEYVYRHYLRQGILLPYTRRAADSMRATATRSLLTAVRVPTGKEQLRNPAPVASTVGYIAGATQVDKVPDDAIFVTPGQSLQDALNKAAGGGRWVVAEKGIHTLPGTLKIPSGVTLSGLGLGTLLHLHPDSSGRDAITNADIDMHDVTIRDLVIEGSVKTDPGTDPNSNRSFRNNGNSGGIIFRGSTVAQMKRIKLENITVQNCTVNGVFIAGAEDVQINRCDFSENGSSMVPGPKLQHNLLVTNSQNVRVGDCRLATSPFGSGAAFTRCKNVTLERCEIARNAFYGVLVTESANISIKQNLVEANDRSGVMLEYLHAGNSNVNVSDNRIQYNNGFAVESYGTTGLITQSNKEAGNPAKKISETKTILMQ